MAEDSPGFWTQRRVEFRDTDAAGLAHFSAFFVWMESVEHEFWRHLGVPLVMSVADDPDAVSLDVVEPGDRATDGVISWPRVAAECDYTGAVRFGDVLSVGVVVEHVGRTSVRFGFRFCRAGVDVAAGAMTAVRCILVPGHPPRPVSLPDQIRSKLEACRTGG